MRRLAMALLAVPVCCAQTPAPQIRAQYEWGYAGKDGQGKGTLSILVDPVPGRVVLELQGLGERLVFLQGDAAAGYHLLIPRREVDQTCPSLAGLPLPFLPRLGSADALYRLLTRGEAPGVKVTKKDALGPVKLRYQGEDEQGRELMVWLTRTRWEPGA